MNERRSYAVDGRMHLEVPLSLSLKYHSAKSDYGAFNCRKHLRSAAGEKERKREGYVMCAMLWVVAYFSATFQRQRGKRGRRERDLKRQFNEQLERTARKDFRRRRRRCILSFQLTVITTRSAAIRKEPRRRHECPLRRVRR